MLIPHKSIPKTWLSWTFPAAHHRCNSPLKCLTRSLLNAVTENRTFSEYRQRKSANNWEPAGQSTLWEGPADGKSEGKAVKLVPETQKNIIVTNWIQEDTTTPLLALLARRKHHQVVEQSPRWRKALEPTRRKAENQPFHSVNWKDYWVADKS